MRAVKSPSKPSGTCEITSEDVRFGHSCRSLFTSPNGARGACTAKFQRVITQTLQRLVTRMQGFVYGAVPWSKVRSMFVLKSPWQCVPWCLWVESLRRMIHCQSALGLEFTFCRSHWQPLCSGLNYTSFGNCTNRASTRLFKILCTPTNDNHSHRLYWSSLRSSRGSDAMRCSATNVANVPLNPFWVYINFRPFPRSIRKEKIKISEAICCNPVLLHRLDACVGIVL